MKQFITMKSAAADSKALKERRLTPVESRCRLCLQETTLCDSHIIPEFFFKQFYDERHRYYHVSTSSKDRIRVLQKGITEKLLCRQCENQFSRYEYHAKNVLYDGVGVTSASVRGGGIVIRGIDYRKFKLFLMSLLWRLAITSIQEWRGIDLGTRHPEQLRGMLQGEIAGEPWRYGCMILQIMYEGQVFKDFIASPSWAKIQGHHLWAWPIGGFAFCFIVSNHRAEVFEKCFVQENGSLLIKQEEFVDIPFLVQTGAKISQAMEGKDLPPIKK